MNFELNILNIDHLAAMASSSSSSSCDCPLCNFNAPTWGLWLSHIRSVHKEDENFAVTCNIGECASLYTKCASFVSHVYRQHRDVVVLGKSRCAPPYNLSSDISIGVDEAIWPASEGDGEVSDLQHAVHQIIETDDSHQQKKNALYILSLKEVLNWAYSSRSE